MRILDACLPTAFLAAAQLALAQQESSSALKLIANSYSSASAYAAFPDKRPDQCPPCFNCLLPAFQCKQFAPCNEYNGMCDCPPGFGGQDCIEPTCGSLADGKNRHVREGNDCDCDDGWTGLNCNVCETNQACNPLMPDQLNGTCYKGGLVVHQNFQMCDVTNRKIVDQLKDKKPQVTFSCKTEDLTCNFQFWVDRRESFYCALDECEFSQDIGYDRNTTNYRCKHIKCSCIPDRMLCGEDGSIDISDFLTEEIKGPGAFSCSSSTNGCTFEEPAMNELISDVFGDRSIKLDCNASECLHYSEVPGFKRPEKPSNTGLIAGSIAAAAVLLVLLAIALWLMARKSQRSDNLGKIRLSDDESAQLLANHTPAMLQFRDVCYEVNGKRILQGVRGNVRPGEILAILGASGAGKTSFLDLLARKNKTGTASGDFFVNGRQIKDSEYKDVIGFVDQEDALMPTLTVYETVLYSALLRLPRDMTIESKRLRVYETLEELGILHIKDSLIGQEGSRGISGGEKRRVSIACELVTSPSILFLDEPTSGLDSYNAYNVAECLSNLARGYNRTIVMTIHQPRSNIVALFDQLVLLARGRVVYSGELSGCQTYFESVGLGCPPGYNIADYLIDLTMNSVSSQFASPLDSSTPRNEASQDDADAGQPHTLARCTSINNESSAWGEIGQRPRNSQAAQQRALFNGKPDLDELFTRYEVSDTASNINDRIKAAVDEAAGKPTEMTTPLGRGYRRIGWPAQFVLLSKRTFKNLYRNPMLLLTHYAIAILLALLCGYLYFRISNDLSGFQGRLGLFFFILALFGFSTLTSLNIFVMERNIFMRERANGYYAPFTYFLAKVMFDIIPLRVLPPIIMGVIIYPTVGLVPEGLVFCRFLLILVLFNLASASVCLLIGITVKEPSIANLIGSLFMLFSLLFAGLLLNHDSIPAPVRWLQKLSIFHYAYEALLVNEVTYLTLTEKKFGLSIDVPGATILSTFGFNAQAFSSDLLGLSVYFAVFLTISFAAMHVLLVERR